MVLGNLQVMAHIVKRKGHTESFDERKVYASVFAACMNTRMLDQQAELIANKVTEEIKRWIEAQNEVTSEQIFIKVVEELQVLNKEAAFMYKTHRDIS